jgi:arginine decarboxylase
MQSMSEYYSAVQLRADHWGEMRALVEELAKKPEGRSAKASHAKIEKLFEQLSTIETYWAFPGVASFNHLRRMFEHGKFSDCAFTIHRITRALTTGAYRRRHIPLDREMTDRCSRPKRAP